MRWSSVDRPVSMGRVLVLGSIAAAAALAVNVVWSLASASTTLLRWWAVPVAGVIGAVVGALDQLRRPETPDPAERAEQQWHLAAPAAPSSRWQPFTKLRWTPGRRTVAGALVAGVVVFGVGGAVTAAAGHYAMGWLTGHESGQDRLVHRARGASLGLHITVTALVQTPHFTLAYVEVDNETGGSVTVPISDGNALLVSGDGTTRRAHAFQSDWDEDLASGQTQRGVITFGGRLPTDATRARLVVLHIFGAGDAAPTFATINGLQLKPAA